MKSKKGMTAGLVAKEASRVLADKAIPNPGLDTEVLLAHVLGCQRVDLLAHGEMKIGPRERNRFMALLERRAKREPLAYLIGKKEFWSLELAVSRAVIIPRPET